MLFTNTQIKVFLHWLALIPTYSTVFVQPWRLERLNTAESSKAPKRFGGIKRKNFQTDRGRSVIDRIQWRWFIPLFLYWTWYRFTKIAFYLIKMVSFSYWIFIDIFFSLCYSESFCKYVPLWGSVFVWILSTEMTL